MTPETVEECQVLQAAVLYNADSLSEKAGHSFLQYEINYKNKKKSINFCVNIFKHYFKNM
jgi:hypothetical protein